VTSAPDGGSLLRVDLDKTTGVERIRIRLSRPDLGEDLLDTTPTGDGGWALANDDVAIPGNWHADVIVRRTNVVDDAGPLRARTRICLVSERKVLVDRAYRR
jgi:hypothetical protein